MANTKDLLGALVGRGLTDSSARRVEHSLSDAGIGGLGGILDQLGLAPAKEKVSAQTRSERSAGGADSANPLDDVLGKLGSIARSVVGEGDKSKSLAAGGLGALVGAILGGGG